MAEDVPEVGKSSPAVSGMVRARAMAVPRLELLKQVNTQSFPTDVHDQVYRQRSFHSFIPAFVISRPTNRSQGAVNSDASITGCGALVRGPQCATSQDG